MAVLDCDLTDLELIGHQYTWEKSRGTVNWIEIRLDRAMADSKWWEAFHSAQLFNLDHICSDHSPIFLQPKMEQRIISKRKFRFENAWLTDSMCLEIVKSSCNLDRNMSISKKLEGCKHTLHDWGHKLTGNFKERIRVCKTALKKLRGRRDERATRQYKEAQN